MREHTLPSAVLTALVATTAHAQTSTPIDAGRGNVPLLAPTTYDPGEPLPLVVALHGFQQDGPEVEGYFNLTPLVELERFLYIAPSGNTNFLGLGYWNAESGCCDLFNNNPNDSAYLRTLIETVQAQFAVDPDRVHLVGYSNGGFMAYRMACDHADLIASLVSLAGATPLPSDPACDPANPVSVLQVHGTADSVIAYNGGTVPLGGPHASAVQSVETWAVFNQCDPVSRPVGDPFDLATDVAGAETVVDLYDQNCADGYESELWTMLGSEHGPPFVSIAPTNAFATLALDWLLRHPKPSPPACAPDLNGDGVLDNADIGTFVTLFLASDPAADFNADAIIDNGDITAFVSAFLAGC